jgi:hypothetical protein
MVRGNTSISRAAPTAKNQAFFREVNERIRQLHVDPHLEMMDWLCECASESCTERIQMTGEEYEALRADGNHFAVAPSKEHVVPEVERVRGRHDRYWIVEMIGGAGEMAERLDPRTRVLSQTSEE